MEVGDFVFIGPGVTFTNVKYPNARQDQEYEQTIIEDNVTIGANATILPSVRVGFGAMIGAGAVVTKDVRKFQTVKGNPAR